VSTEDPVDRARAAVRAARRVVVLTGAGISAESGVPTFRGAGGLWREHRAEDLATPGAFARDPRLVWEWYWWRRRLVARCAPNAAHLALARLALVGGTDPGDALNPAVRIVTQNVDGLHGAAARLVAAELLAAAARDAAPDVMNVGRGPTRGAVPLELHGSLFRSRCTRCAARYEHYDPADVAMPEALPTCARCGALLRPDVVWFGESLDEHVLREAFDAAARADLCLVVGTSGVVQPAASLASVTREAGGRVVEVNPDETPITAIADVVVRGRAAEVVPRIMEYGVPSIE
jgi:NAD-dependent deacetylase